MFIFNKRLHLIYYLSHYKTNHCCTNIHCISLLVAFQNLPKFSILIEIKKIYIIYLNLHFSFQNLLLKMNIQLDHYVKILLIYL
jgi:hypothetical protein